MWPRCNTGLPVGASTGSGIDGKPDSASALLDKGGYTAETVNDLDRAISLYEKVVPEAAHMEVQVKETPLRAKVDPDPRRPSHIHAIRDIGDRLPPEPIDD